MYLLAITTGMRQGLFGLRWENIDLDSRIVSVSRTLQETPDGFQLVKPKAPKSRRTIRLTDAAIATLKVHRKKTAQDRLAAGGWKGDWNLVFCDSQGGPLWKHKM